MFWHAIPTALAAAPTDFQIDNPIGAEDLGDIVQGVVGSLLDIVIPIAVAMYLYAGFLWLTSAGEPAKVNRARKVFTYTTLGLIVMLIGGGFVDLIRSVLNLGQ